MDVYIAQIMLEVHVIKEGKNTPSNINMTKDVLQVHVHWDYMHTAVLSKLVLAYAGKVVSGMML